MPAAAVAVAVAVVVVVFQWRWVNGTEEHGLVVAEAASTFHLEDGQGLAQRGVQRRHDAHGGDKHVRSKKLLLQLFFELNATRLELRW